MKTTLTLISFLAFAILASGAASLAETTSASDSMKLQKSFALDSAEASFALFGAVFLSAAVVLRFRGHGKRL